MITIVQHHRHGCLSTPTIHHIQDSIERKWVSTPSSSIGNDSNNKEGVCTQIILDNHESTDKEEIITPASYDINNNSTTVTKLDNSIFDNDPSNKEDFVDYKDDDSDDIKNDINYSDKKFNHYQSVPDNVVASHIQCDVCLIGISYNRFITE